MTDTATTPAGQLDEAERRRLRRLESTIERAVDAAGRIAGEALATIRDERLYRVTHRSFELYVIERFGFSRATAYRMIDAANQPAIEPPERETAGQPVSGRDTSADPGDEAPADLSHRMWATVASRRANVVRLHVNAEEAPPVGARVEVLW